MPARPPGAGRVPRFLYILSLERSGSTPLAWNLGSLPGVVALGEVDRSFTLMTRPQGLPRACSCGAAARDCAVWGPVVAAADRLRPLPLVARYRLMDEILGANLGPDTVVVDASKSLESYMALSAAAPGRVAAVHLVKDVRAYLDSTLRRMATMDPERLWAEQLARRPLRARLMRAMPQSLLYLLRWSRQNAAMRRALASGGAPWMRIGYEDLCRDPERHLAAMGRLARAAEGPSGPHILFGSFAYLDGDGAMALRYDDRWTRSPRRRLLEAAAGAVAGSNRRLARPDGSATTL